MVRTTSIPTELRMKHDPQAWQRVERWRSSVPASISAPVIGRDDEFYPRAQQRAERRRPSVPASIPAPVTGRDDEFYLTDEMTVFQVCGHLIRFVSQSLTHHDAAFLTISFLGCRSKTCFSVFPSAFFLSTPSSSAPCSRCHMEMKGSRVDPMRNQYTSPV